MALQLKDGKVLATFPVPPPPEETSVEIEAGPCKWPDSKRFQRVGPKEFACKTQSNHLQSYSSRCCQPESEGFGRAETACNIQVIVGTEQASSCFRVENPTLKSEKNYTESRL